MTDFLTANLASSSLSSLRVIFSASLAFILSVSIGLTYVKTFRGLSYSRNFVQAIMLSSIVTAMVIHAIGDSVAIGIGTLGALSIIRFRTNLKDPRDIIFLFAALAAGITCGIGAYFMHQQTGAPWAVRNLWKNSRGGKGGSQGKRGLSHTCHYCRTNLGLTPRKGAEPTPAAQGLRRG